MINDWCGSQIDITHHVLEVEGSPKCTAVANAHHFIINTLLVLKLNPRDIEF